VGAAPLLPSLLVRMRSRAEAGGEAESDRLFLFMVDSLFVGHAEAALVQAATSFSDWYGRTSSETPLSCCLAILSGVRRLLSSVAGHQAAQLSSIVATCDALRDCMRFSAMHAPPGRPPALSLSQSAFVAACRAFSPAWPALLPLVQGQPSAAVALWLAGAATEAARQHAAAAKRAVDAGALDAAGMLTVCADDYASLWGTGMGSYRVLAWTVAQQAQKAVAAAPLARLEGLLSAAHRLLDLSENAALRDASAALARRLHVWRADAAWLLGENAAEVPALKRKRDEPSSHDAQTGALPDNAATLLAGPLHLVARALSRGGVRERPELAAELRALMEGRSGSHHVSI